MQNLIDEAANNWHKTRDQKYKDLWYKLVREYANGPHNIIRRRLQSRAGDKADVSKRTTDN